jgi:hypothetical protein
MAQHAGLNSKAPLQGVTFNTQETSMNDSRENFEDLDSPAPLRKRSKGIYMLPNMVTLAALFAGFYAIVMAINGRFDLATVGIFSAMVLDSLDGRGPHDQHPKCLR